MSQSTLSVECDGVEQIFLQLDQRSDISSHWCCLSQSYIVLVESNKWRLFVYNSLKQDLSASIVVYLVAVPLCLGIALASGAPLFSGIISGIIGGILVGAISNSALGVSGPAAGLAVIVLSAIDTLGSWDIFLMSVVLAGVFQILMGHYKAGFIAYFFPNSVIKGMLTGIGLLIIIKQLPHALGYDHSYMGEYAFHQVDGENSFSALLHAFGHLTPAAVIISMLSLAVLLLWDLVLAQKHKIFQLIQGPLVVVLLGITLNLIFKYSFTEYSLQAEHLVNLPVPSSLGDFFGQFSIPNFSAITNPDVWQIAVVLALVASIETLLCVEATDKLDPQKRSTSTNRELQAQGVGNVISGLIGGLPITQVIVRSSANINFGAKTKLSAILHGVWLLISALVIAQYLNMLPLASLAAILISVGYKLAKPVLFKQMYKLGEEQFVPFLATILAILFTDLLKGVIIGLMFGLFYTLKHSYRNTYYIKEVVEQHNGESSHHIVLAEEVSFFNKASLRSLLDSIPSNASVIIDCSRSKSISYDVVELIKDFKDTAINKNIDFKTIGFIEH